MKELAVKLTVNELNIVLESLGNLPYLRVFELIERIRFQAQEQLNGSTAANGASREQEGNGAVRIKEEMHAS